jgi:iron complex transport system substrate-binding protein
MPRRSRPARRPTLAVPLAVLLAGLVALVSPASASPVPTPPPAPARRVVTLAPNLTEIVYAIGAEKALVGVSDLSDYPPAASSLPKVGGLDPSAERIASLRPDLVLVTAEGGKRKGAAAALAAAGIPVLRVPAGSLAEVIAGIRLVGERLGASARAEALAASLEERRRAVAGASAPAAARPAAVLLVWPDPPSAAGGGTFLDDVLVTAGARNLVAARTGWPVLSAEWLATAPIDVLVLPDSPENRPAFDRALASGALSRGTAARARIVRLPESPLTRPGPRVFDALERLARALRSEPETTPGPAR